MRARPLILSLAAGLAAAPASALAAPGRWTLVGRPVGSSGNVGLLRTADSRLHAAWLRQARNGAAVLTDTAFSTSGATRARTIPGGQQPVLISDASTEPDGLRAFSVVSTFPAGARIVTATAGLDGPWTDGGVAAVGPGITSGSTVPSATRRSNGGAVLAWSEGASFSPTVTSMVEVQPGIGAAPVALAPGVAANIATDLDFEGGIGVAWCNRRPEAATVDPGTGRRIGPIRVMPQTTRCAGSSRTPLVTRRISGGLYMLGGGRHESLRLWRIGAARSALITRDAPPTTLQGAPSALAASFDGRLWVGWSTPRPHRRPVVKVRRVGASVGDLGAVTTVPIPRSWSNVRRLDIAANAKGVEILAVVTRNSNEVGLLHTVAEPSLSVAVRPRNFAHGHAHRIRVRVTDTRAGVKGARVRAAGRRARTDSDGRAVIRLPAFPRPRPVRLVVRKPSYVTARVRLRAR